MDPKGKPPWPVTLDTKWSQCLTPKCPKNSYPGLWEAQNTKTPTVCLKGRVEINDMLFYENSWPSM